MFPSFLPGSLILDALRGQRIKPRDSHKGLNQVLGFLSFSLYHRTPAWAWGCGLRQGQVTLTPLPQELFKKVVPYHCLGSIWSQRDKKGKEHLAPTIRATVTQFNSVANCVITTCLGDQSTKAPDRARVVEHWIEVARVGCRSGLGTPLHLLS
jgi:hypothetical protein